MHSFWRRGAGHRVGMVALMCVGVLYASAAFAQDETTPDQAEVDGVNVQMFRPSIFGGHFVAIEDARTLTRWSPGIAVIGDYANSVWSKYDEDDELEFDFVSEMSTAHLMAALGLWNWVSIGVDVPLHLTRKRTFENIETGAGLSPELEEWREVGDVRAEMKLGILREEKHWLGLALAPYVIIPTDVEEHLNGENRVTGGGMLALEHDFGPLNVGLNGGYLYRGTNDFFGTEIGDAIRFGAGIGNQYDSGFFWSLEGWGHHFAIEDTELVRPTPVEWTAVLGWRFGERGPKLFAGGGTGVMSGIGAPQYRVLAGLSYYYVRGEKAELRVRVIDAAGSPVNASLAIDGPEGQVLQMAQDGSYTLKNAKPGAYTVTGSKDGYQDDTKSAVLKSGQGVEIVLTLNAIVAKATTVTFVVTDKCTGDPVDAMVTVQGGEVMSATGGATGKKDIAAGAFKADVKAAGYQLKTVDFSATNETDTTVEVKLYPEIKALGSVYFAVNKDKILPQSFVVLDDVAAQIKKLCEFNKVVIEGHTDSDGSDAANLDLSQRRAASVRQYLIGKGIDPAKLEPMGFGESQPISSNETADGKAQNRRVEFKIVE